jgi:cell division transport system permease protein
MAAAAIDIPFDRDGSGRFLPWLVALMVYLAALALSGALVLERTLESWDRGLAGTLTVELPPALSGGNGGLAAVLKDLTATPGVVAARPLSRAEMTALLAPWLGTGVPDDLALPQLVDVRIDPQHLDENALAARLAKDASGAAIDDQRQWLDRLAGAVRAAEGVAGAIVLLIGAASVLTVIFTTRAGLAVHRDVIELLHLMGARDGYIARQFQRQAMRLGLRGGAAGIALALVTLLALARAGDALGTAGPALPSLALRPLQLAAMALLPLAAACLAMLAARLTVMRALARMP